MNFEFFCAHIQHVGEQGNIFSMGGNIKTMKYKRHKYANLQMKH